MKKIIFIVLISFILAGCSAEYQLEIKKGKIYEKTKITIINDENIIKCNNIALECDNDSGEIMNFHFSPLTNDDYQEYFLDNEYNENGAISTRTFDFTYENFKYSYVLNECFETYSYDYKTNELYIKASNFKCYHDSNITVKILTDYEVYENNADRVNGNTYIWYITGDNYSTKDLIIRLRPYALTPYILWGSVIIVCIGIITFFIKKSKKINEIN